MQRDHPAPTAHQQHDLDLTVLDELVGHDPQKFRKFALLFISSLEDVLQQIDAACAVSDVARLGAMGHRAKSTAMNIGAVKFSGMCLQLEQAAKANDLVQADALAQGLRPVFEEIRTAIGLRLAA
jgi:HPt (histidine-containing phosphotransfer) domain-containing protein